MTVPEQCEKCVLLDTCLENECIKEKPCLTRLEPVEIDEDLMREMRERMGI